MIARPKLIPYGKRDQVTNVMSIVLINLGKVNNEILDCLF